MFMKTREEITKEVLNILEKNCYVGTTVLSTGTGKSKIAVDAIKQGKFKNILITSPRTTLKSNWEKELEKWDLKPTGTTTNPIQIIIENIQTAYKWDKDTVKSFDLIIFDEIHTMTTPKYGELIQLASELSIPRLGLTATPDISDKEEKLLFYQEYCPIVYLYSDSEKDGITNKKRVYVLRYNLTNDHTVEVKTKTKSWRQGELAYYTYLESVIEEQKALIQRKFPLWDVLGVKAVYALKGPNTPPELKQILGKYWWAITTRKKLLWNLESSKRIALKLKEKILNSRKKRTWDNNKVLIFSELTDKCQDLSKYAIHSKQDKKHNQSMIDLFNSGKIRELASCQSLTLGMNLIGANFAIFESFNSSETNNTQKQGRLNRLPITDTAILIYIVPVGTQSEVWFSKATENQEISELNANSI